jgi:eukaryotic-like serine/threonine-protein kinase
MSDLTKVCPMCSAEYGANQTFCSNDGATLRPMVEKKGDLTDTVVADRYRVLKKLGEGGMGQVYLAEHVRMKRKSALKVMRPDVGVDPDAIARFTREATNASHIEHPNVAAIHDFGETSDGVIYLAMEFVEGKPLSSVLEDEGAMPPARAASVIRQTAAGLQAAHELSIVHRDLKPDNIMVARNKDGTDKVKIVDFGIAKATNNDSQKVTSTGVMIGTPAYMSPEQVGGGVVNGSTDQFSLACTAFEMLTGELPFEGTTTYELITARITGSSRRLHQVRTDITWPAGLEDVLQKAMAPTADARYATVVAFADAFEAAVKGLTVPDLRPSQAGTQVLTAKDLPPTRVGPSAGAAPAAAPAGKASATSSPASAPAPEKKGSGMMIGIAAVVLVAVGGGAVMMKGGSASAPPAADAGASTASVTEMSKPVAGGMPETNAAAPAGGSKPATSGNTAGPTPSTPRPNQSATTAAAPAPTGKSTTPTAGPAAPSAGPTAAAPAAAAPAAETKSAPAAFDASAELASIKGGAQSDDDAENRQAISKVAALLPKLTAKSDSIIALYYRAQAQASLGQDAEACRTLTRAGDIATGSRMATTIANTRQRLECP